MTYGFILDSAYCKKKVLRIANHKLDVDRTYVGQSANVTCPAGATGEDIGWVLQIDQA